MSFFSNFLELKSFKRLVLLPCLIPQVSSISLLFSAAFLFILCNVHSLIKMLYPVRNLLVLLVSNARSLCYVLLIAGTLSDLHSVYKSIGVETY